jgi:hypothetical protein
MLETLFWNRSIRRIYLLPGAQAPDKFAAPGVVADASGLLLRGGKPVRQAVVLDDSATTVQLADAHRLASGGPVSLWQPNDAARVSLMMWGRLHGGTLLNSGGIWLWPKSPSRAGWVVFRLRTQDPTQQGSFTLYNHQRPVSTKSLAGGVVTTLRLPICSPGRWSRGFASQNAVAAVPRYVPDSRACAATQ